jgi:hypothetical protein
MNMSPALPVEDCLAASVGDACGAGRLARVLELIGSDADVGVRATCFDIRVG